MSEPDSPQHSLHAEALADLSRVIQAIQSHTSLTSRWNGSLQVRGLDFGFSGQKHRSCAISIREDVLRLPANRWSTMIHEGLHSVSNGFVGAGFVADVWEEAVVEQAQRLLRPMILSDLGIAVPGDDLPARDELHPYNADIRRLEIVRRALGRDSRDFYLMLLAPSPPERVRFRIEAQRRLQSDGEIES